MARRLDLAGKIFNHLRILRPRGKNESGGYLWVCECLLCGKRKTLNGSLVKAGRIKSCGCLVPISARATHNKARGASHAKWKGGAKNRGSIAYFNSLVNSMAHRPSGKINFTGQDLANEYAKSNKTCRISGRRESDCGVLHADHCYDTGNFRGFICEKLNLALGAFEHNPKLLRAAANYLENSNAR